MREQNKHTKEKIKMRNMKFGVEVEFFGKTRHEVASALNARGINAYVEGYNHETRGYWKLVTDSSVTNTGCDTSNGNEIVSPILYGEDGLKQLAIVLEVMNSLGCKVDKTCGVHVHHDISDLNIEQIKNVYRLYSKYENVINLMMPESRRNKRWAKKIGQFEMARVEQATDTRELGNAVWDRYYTVNFQSYVKYGTIEFRQHGGSLDFEKISNWVIITHTLVERAQTVKKVNEIKSEQERYEFRRLRSRFLKELSLTDDINEYINKRTNFFIGKERGLDLKNLREVC